MLYQSELELPRDVRDVLPTAAQDLYRRTYNQTWRIEGHSPLADGSQRLSQVARRDPPRHRAPRPRLQRRHHRLVVIAKGHDLDTRGVIVQPPHQLERLAAGHVQVHQGQVYPARHGCLNLRRVPGRCGHLRLAARLQQHADAGLDEGGVRHQ